MTSIEVKSIKKGRSRAHLSIVDKLVGGEGHLEGLELMEEDVNGFLTAAGQAERAPVRRLEVLHMDDAEVDRFSKVLHRDRVLKVIDEYHEM